MTITLNVIPATMPMNVMSGAPTLVPIPTGSVSGCGAQGSSGQGPPPGTINGCVTAVSRISPLGTVASLAPTRGTLTNSGNTLLYTPSSPAFSGTDKFTVFVEGVNTDGQMALSTDEVLVTVTVSPNLAYVPTLGTVGMIILAIGLSLLGMKQIRRHAA